MAGILLVTHNGLGDSLIDCVGHVLGKAPAELMVLSFRAQDDAQRKEAEGRAVIEHLDDGSGVLILADMFGATPCNVAMRLCELPNVKGVAGLNLPMLLRALTNRDKPLAELAQIAQEGALACIVPIEAGSGGKCDAAA